jgi:hypothetical protein
MNIFYTHASAEVCALDHSNRHCIKMILEYAQMLSTAHRKLDGHRWADEQGLMKSTHENHPCTFWVEQSTYHYKWLFDMWVYLLYQYRTTYGRNHKVESLMPALVNTPYNMVKRGFKPCYPVGDVELAKQIKDVKLYYRYYLIQKYNAWDAKGYSFDYPWGFPNWLSKQDGRWVYVGTN